MTVLDELVILRAQNEDSGDSRFGLQPCYSSLEVCEEGIAFGGEGAVFAVQTPDQAFVFLDHDLEDQVS